MLKTIRIHKHKTDSILRRHPWIFSGAIADSTDDLSDGETVTVTDAKGRFLARGHFQHATIAVRVLSFEDVEIDAAFFQSALKRAIELRKSMQLFTKENSICRLVHGEGDSLPGLVVDFYNGTAVVQCHSLGMYANIEHISNGLIAVLGKSLKAVYSKSSDTLPQRADIVDAYVYGKCETPHIAKEHGVSLSIDWVTGQKTGFFIDQRENRFLLGKYSEGKKVLNTFCYSGGFSLLALKHGASLVHSLDSSKKAIVLTEENVRINGFEDRHGSIVADAMEYMKDLPEDYDIIILDPPAFAKHREKRHKAIQGYKRLNAHAIRQIKPGGIIFTFSCSQVVDKYLFNNTIIAAAIEAGRNVRILEQLHQPADHPINAFHPEGEYLKGLVIQVD
ncbi:MAG: class I SAM-dependent rRNA methyltransferase [Crocinitomicaceae bacterium]|nr:class I SAM-dependent rRNA methyltransferase [Crocinitomicaceae bacterium]MCF8434168.1 class I SAM-dependent rRNA methyltransferase [Crocinitomicaceae bacterium]